ncbi:MAG: NifU family protein [Anaerolineales bacterium]|nr:NifU family protein [Anaerolineales bacterium]
MSKQMQVINISDSARDKIKELIEGTGKDDLAVRVKISLTGTSGYQTEFSFTPKGTIQESDLVQVVDTFTMVFDKNSAAVLSEANVDYDEERYQGGFRIQYTEDNLEKMPPSKEWGDPVAQTVQRVIDTQLNPGLASHNGFVNLLGVKGDTVFIEMGGGCQGCARARMTLKESIEKIIFENVPEVQKVLDTTEHAEGKNPYFQQ